jgi:hypothetical protein
VTRESKAAVAAAQVLLPVSLSARMKMAAWEWNVVMHLSQSAEQLMPIWRRALSYDAKRRLWEPANRSNTVGPAVKVKWDSVTLEVQDC